MSRLLLIFFLFFFANANAQFNLIYNSANYSLPSTNNYPRALDYNKDGSVFLALNTVRARSINNGTNWSNAIITPTVCCNNTSPNQYALGYRDSLVGLFTGYSINSSSDYVVSTTNGNITSSCNNLVTFNEAVAMSISDFESDTCIYVDQNSNIFVSFNKGVSWNDRTFYNGQIYAQSTSFVDPLHFFVFGTNAYKTSNGGLSYTTIAQVPSYTPLASSFCDTMHGYLLVNNNGGIQNIYKTVNGGYSWVPLFSASLVNEELFRIQAISEDTVFVIGNNKILRTTNGGQYWEVMRFQNENFTSLDFLNSQVGVVGSNSGLYSKIYKTTNGGGILNPYSSFSIQNGACCQNVVCNIINNGPALYSYQWLLDDTLISNSFVPGSVSVSAGNHNLTLVTTYQGRTDTVSKDFYSAPPASYMPTITATISDTTICMGSTAKITVNNTQSGYSYHIYNNNSLFESITSGNYHYTSAIDSNVIAELREGNQYWFCPGNTTSKYFNITMLNLPPDTLLHINPAVVCEKDTIQIVLPNQNNWTYELFTKQNGSNATYLNTGPPTPGTTVIANNHSYYFYYTLFDSNTGCTSHVSPVTQVRVDSVKAILGVSIPAVYIGDTISIYSPGASYTDIYQFDYGPSFYDALNKPIVKLRFDTVGKKEITLYATSQIGCRDTAKLYMGVYNKADTSTGTVCKMFSTNEINNQFHYVSAYSKPRPRLHLDIAGNYYFYNRTEDWGAGNSPYYYHYKLYLDKFNIAGNLIRKIEPTYISSGNYAVATNHDIVSDSSANIYFNGFGRNNIQFCGMPFQGGFSGVFIIKADSMGVGKHMWTYQYNWVKSNIGTFTLPGYNTLIFPQHDKFHVVDSAINNKWQKTIFPPTYYDFTFLQLPLGIDYVNSNDVFSIGSKTCVVGDKILNYYLTHSDTFNSNKAVVDVYDKNTHALINKIEVFSFGQEDKNAFNMCSAYPDDRMFERVRYNIVPDKEGNFYVYCSTGNYNFIDSIGCLYKFNYIIPGNITLSSKTDITLIEKFDLNGNLLFYNTSSAHVSNIVVNGDKDLIGAGTYNLFAGFSSQDGHNSGIVDGRDSAAAILFAYNHNGGFKWAEKFNTQNLHFAEDITTSNNCDNKIHFILNSNGSVNFKNSGNTVPNTYTIYTYSPDNNCNFTAPCNWYVWNDSVPSNNSGVNTVNPAGLINIYPNPSNGIINIAIDGNLDGAAEVKLINVLGECVYTKHITSNQTEMDVKNLTSGIYFVKVNVGKATMMRKVVLN